MRKRMPGNLWSGRRSASGSHSKRPGRTATGNILERKSVFTKIAEEYGAEQVIYAHCHGETRFHDSLEGAYGGILYRLASGDFLRWKPLKIL